MGKKLNIAVMGLFFTVLYLGMNYYVYRSSIRGLEVAPVYLWLLRGGFFVIGSFFIFGMVLRKKAYIKKIAYLGNFWLGILSMAISVFILRDLGIFLLDVDVGRSTVVSLGITLLITGYSYYNGTRVPTVREVTIPTRKIKDPSDGVTITQLTDIHIGMATSKKWLQKTVERANELNSDYMVITGDLIDDRLDKIKAFLPILKELRASGGKYTIIGNHEIYSGLKDYHRFVKESGLTPLRNEGIRVSKHLEIFGVDDLTVEKYLETPVHLEEILKNRDPARYTLLLLHQPERFHQAVDLGVDLQLSGHTHSGQIPPLEWIIPFYFRYSKGLYQREGAYIYTSPGTGVWGPPMRFLSKNEITKFHIVPEGDGGSGK